MSQNLAKAQKVSVAEIVRHGEQLILPTGMTLDKIFRDVVATQLQPIKDRFSIA